MAGERREVGACSRCGPPSATQRRPPSPKCGQPELVELLKPNGLTSREAQRGGRGVQRVPANKEGVRHRRVRAYARGLEAVWKLCSEGLSEPRLSGVAAPAHSVCTMFLSSISSDGAHTTMPGMQPRYARSKLPWCVGPSLPTRPARSRIMRTGSFWMATSCITWS